VKVTRVIDATYALSEVPVTIRHPEQGRAKGKVVMTKQRTSERSAPAVVVYLRFDSSDGRIQRDRGMEQAPVQTWLGMS
jgi:hypothetical protein